MQPESGGLGLGVTPIGPTWDPRALLPRRRQPGPRRRGAAALRGPQLAADRSRRRTPHLPARHPDRPRRRASSAESSTACCRGCSTSSGRSRSTCSRSASRPCCSRSGFASGRCKLEAGSLLLPIVIIGVVFLPYVARPMRGEVLSLRAERVRRGRDRARRLELAPALERDPAERDHDRDRLLPAHDRDRAC